MIVLKDMPKITSLLAAEPFWEDMSLPSEWYAGGFGLAEILDLVLMTAILAGLAMYLVHRRAGKMILGGFFVVVLMVLAIVCDFPILGGVSKEILSIPLLVLLILYHDEVRDILRQIGCFPQKLTATIRKIRSPGISKKMEVTIDEVCDAANRMSESKTGALMVLKRAGGLKEYMENATFLNAEVQSHLLCTIFYNGSPLHDGAVIIEGNRIRAARCQLPSANPEGLDPSLGERHKAAVGMSVSTDAVVVVVSEETGIISIVMGGMMKRGCDKDDLREELTRLLGNYASRVSAWGDNAAWVSAQVEKTKKHEKPSALTSDEDVK